MSEGYIKAAGGSIWYSVYGEDREETPILVVHGGPGFLTMPEVIKEFAKERPVYFYDQLGSGKSDKAIDKEYYSTENFVNELEEVISALKLSEVILMGFSWGCALICAYMLDKKPRLVKALVLSAPYLSSLRWYQDQRENISKMPDDVIKAIEEGEERCDFGDTYQEAMMEYYKKHVCKLDPWPDYVQDALGKLNMEVYLTMWGPSEFTISGKLKNYDLCPSLAQITIPVLLTCGDMDESGVKTVKDYQMAFSNANMAVIPKASHLHQIEQPLIYKTIVREFLRDI